MAFKNVAIIDVDGCLIDYPQVFLDWIYKISGHLWSSIKELKQSISHEQYEILKHSYRISGIKRILSVLSAAKKTLTELKKRALLFGLLRQDLSMRRLFLIQYIGYGIILTYRMTNCFFVKNKLNFIKGIKGADVRIVVEDEYEIVKKLKNNAGMFVYWLNKNNKSVDNKDFVVVKDWNDIHSHLQYNNLL